MSADAWVKTSNWALEPEAGGSAGVPGQPGLQRTLSGENKAKDPARWFSGVSTLIVRSHDLSQCWGLPW